MAIRDWYFDAVNGLDTNPGTLSQPKQWWENFPQPSAAPGDTFWFRRSTTQVLVNQYTQLKGGTSDTARCRYAVYGESDYNYMTWTKPSGLGGMVMNLSNALAFLDVEDMRFDAQGVNANAIYNAIQGASNAGNMRFYRSHFLNATSSGYNTGTEGGKTGVLSGLVFEDCEAYDNGGHGLILSGVNTSIARRSKFYRNGATLSTGGHGFSSGAAKTTASSGWTNTSGAVWQRTLAANETAVYYVRTSVSAYLRLRPTAGTQTAPSAGEFGVSGGILYINVGVDPNGKGVIYAWKRAYGLIVEDCIAYENYWNRSAPDHEGHGFAADDWADDCIFRRNLSYNNEGAGFSINRGDRNVLFSNIAFGNGQAGVIGSPCDSLVIKHNTFDGNNTGSGATSAEIFSNGSSKDWIVSNNILIPTVAYGISRETTDTGFTGADNNIKGHTVAPEKNPFLTGTKSVDPLFDSLYRPQEAELIRAGSNLGGKDFYDKPFYSAPNIGAVDDVSNTPRYSISLR